MTRFDSRVTDTALHDVPSFIEFNPDDSNEEHGIGDDYDLVDNARAEDIEDAVHQDDVTHQELDAMKRMVQDMRRNPLLLHQSPVYSKSTLSYNDYTSVLEPLRPIVRVGYSSNAKSQASPRHTPNTTTTNSLATPTTKKTPPYCQECSTSPASPRMLIAQTNAMTLISKAPPLPFPPTA